MAQAAVCPTKTNFPHLEESFGKAVALWDKGDGDCLLVYFLY